MEVSNGEFMIIIELLVLIGIIFYITTLKALNVVIKNYDDIKTILLKVDGNEVNERLVKYPNLFTKVKAGPDETTEFKFNVTKLDKCLVEEYIRAVEDCRVYLFKGKTELIKPLIIYSRMVHNVIELCNAIKIDIPKNLLTKQLKDYINSNVVKIVNLPSNNEELFNLIYTFETYKAYTRIALGNYDDSVITSSCMDIMELLEKSKFKYIDVRKLKKS